MYNADISSSLNVTQILSETLTPPFTIDLNSAISISLLFKGEMACYLDDIILFYGEGLDEIFDDWWAEYELTKHQWWRLDDKPPTVTDVMVQTMGKIKVTPLSGP